MNKSPARHTFQKENYLKRKAAEGKTAENNENVKAMVQYYESWDKKMAEQQDDPAWKENNLEYDLRSTEWICNKTKASESYAQNLYAAMCNNDFQRNDMMPILRGQTWSCSWRSAGGIVADMREEGDYIEWYCSGMRGDGKSTKPPDNFVGESCVTDEIRKDLKKLGWVVITVPDDDIL